MIAVSMIYETRSEHIKVSIPLGYEEDTDEYKNMEQRVIVMTIFFWVMGLIEFIIIFSG